MADLEEHPSDPLTDRPNDPPDPGEWWFARFVAIVAVVLAQGYLWVVLSVLSGTKGGRLTIFGMSKPEFSLTPFGLPAFYVLVFGFLGYWLLPDRHRTGRVATAIIIVAALSLLLAAYAIHAYTSPLQGD